jgi:uroporphyrinogen decarboxylase
MAEMTSRERAIAALNHLEADRVPIDLGSMNATTIHAVAHRRLLEALGLEKPASDEWISFHYQIVKPTEALRRRFGVDFYGLTPNPPANFRSVVNPEDNSILDEWGIKYQKPPDSHYFDMVGHPLAEASLDDLLRYHWPDPRDPARFAGLADQARDLHENSNYALVVNGAMGSGIVQMCSWLCGLENNFANMVLDPTFVTALVDRLVDFHIAFWDAMLDAVGPYVQVVVTSDDLGTQNGPLINPATYRRLFKEAHRRLFSFIKSKADVKIMFHSCGSVYQFIPDLIEVGVDALNPVQYQTRDMDTAKLKREFGDHLAFWGGGCETQRILPTGTPQEVREEVRRRMADLKPGGGFVFCQVHNIQVDVPPENIVALFEAAKEFGRYG